MAEKVEKLILRDIQDAVQGFEARANFACGGTIPIFHARRNIDDFGAKKGPITCSPVTLSKDAQDQYNSALKELIDDCAPASFGRDGKDVFDEAYRKATKLDNTQFAVDFTPYDYGIISAIAQTILPGFAVPKLHSKNTALEHIGVVAELYKLNVYSAPSGMFKAHIDTPRGLTQFGSLVVCLPCQHQGGSLRVSHKGHQVVYDWSNKDAKAVTWAAFFSDVEHEVNSVTSGNRITLTYNLYISEHIGGVVNPLFPSVDPAYYPLYECAGKAMERHEFMPSGGVLGFHCCHKYAHTDGEVERRMPFALKGLDIAIFTVFGELGLQVSVRPMVELDYELDYESFHDPQEYGYSPPTDLVEKGMDEDEISDEMMLQHCLPRFGQFIGIREGGTYSEGEDEAKTLQEMWPHEQHDVTWLNLPQHKPEENIAYIAHGNEASLKWFYTRVAILIEVLDSSSRGNARANRNMPVVNVEKNFEMPKSQKKVQGEEWPPSFYSSLPDTPDEDPGEAKVTDSSARMSWVPIGVPITKVQDE